MKFLLVLLFIAFCVYFFFNSVFKFLFGVRTPDQKKQQSSSRQQKSTTGNSSSNKNSSSKKIITPDEGEYVDFEEIKD